MAKILFSKEFIENLSPNTECDYHEGTYGNLGRLIASIRVKRIDDEQYVEVDFPFWEYDKSREYVNLMIVPKGKWAGKDKEESELNG